MANKEQKVILKFKNDEFVSQLTRLIMSAGKVKVSGLGIFEVRKIAAREGYNVGNGNRIKIPAHNKLVFRPTKKLRVIIQGHGN